MASSVVRDALVLAAAMGVPAMITDAARWAQRRKARGGG